jgi:hypothetical protein
MPSHDANSPVMQYPFVTRLPRSTTLADGLDQRLTSTVRPTPFFKDTDIDTRPIAELQITPRLMHPIHPPLLIGDRQHPLDDFMSSLASSSDSLPRVPRHLLRRSRPSPEDVSILPTLSHHKAFSPDGPNVLLFVRKTLNGYVQEACAPLPVWKLTRAIECEICE